MIDAWDLNLLITLCRQMWGKGSSRRKSEGTSSVLELASVLRLSAAIHQYRPDAPPTKFVYLTRARGIDNI